jgi:ABC-type uncharacterized transport system permease subunit
MILSSAPELELAPGLPLGLALGGVCALAYALAALATPKLGSNTSRGILALAWALHALTLLAGLLDGPTHFGFAPAISATAWLVLTLYGVETRFYPQLHARRTLSALGAVCVLMGVLWPGQPLHLSASPWLPLHWVLGIASYGLFGTAVIHAWLMSRTEKSIRQATAPDTGLPLLTLERMTFRFVNAGFVLLTLTLLAGLVFGEALYGQPWRWEHKTIFSVLSWLAFAILLLGRARFGWRGQRAAQGVYIGASLLLLAYVGSRFVFEVLLGRSFT